MSNVKEDFTYRILEPSESSRMVQLHRDVYVMSEERAARWYSLPHGEQIEESFGAFTNKRMVAGLSTIYYRIRLGGRTVTMGGVGGVATQPEYRNSGHVKRLLGLSLARMRERGVPVSGLYPFKYAFYRKYGWEHAQDHLRLVLPIRSFVLREGINDDSNSQFLRAEDFSSKIRELDSVYQKATAQYNCAVVRSREDWERTAKRLKNIESDGRNVYVYLGLRGGEPVSYVNYSFSPSGESRRLEIREAFGIDAKAYRDILRFIAAHDSQAHEVSWDVPADTPVRQILSEPCAGTLVPRLMFRVVDAESILNLFARGKEGTESTQTIEEGDLRYRFSDFTVSLNDILAPWNNKTFLVTAEGAKVFQGESLSTSTGPDLAMDIAAFSQIVSGYKSASQCADQGYIQVRSHWALKAMDMLFPRRTTFCTDYF